MTTFESTRIALVGGAGFIGHHLAIGLSARGFNVWVIDSLQVNNILSLASGDNFDAPNDVYWNMSMERLRMLRDAGVRVHTLDARDYHALCHHLKQIQPDVIVHLAAVAHADASNKDPHSTFDHSLRTLENALDNARSRELQVRRFIYFSSSMVYGHFRSAIVDEETPCDPVGIYGALKLSGERMVIAYHQVFGLPYTIIRPSALYGERCISRRVCQVFIENAINGEPIRISNAGRDRLDFTYIDDVVNGVCLAIIRKSAANHILNMTFGQSRSISELAELLKERFPSVKLESKENDSLTPRRGTLSIDKATALLGYRPEFPLEVGFSRYVEWYLSRNDVPCAVG